MCLQGCPWIGALSLVCVRLFVLSKEQKDYSPHQELLKTPWRGMKQLWLAHGLEESWISSSFKILVGFFSVIHLCPKGTGFSSSNPILWVSCCCCCRSQESCWFLCQGSDSAEVNAELALQLLLSPKPSKYCSMHILLHTCCIGYFKPSCFRLSFSLFGFNLFQVLPLKEG